MGPFSLLSAIFAFLTLAGLFLAPCDSVFAASNSPQNVRLQLKWRHQFQFAGYYAAVSQGFFEDEGLQVELLEGAPGIDPAARLVSGEAEFAVDSPAILIKRQEGSPLVALAAIFQHSPSVMMTLKDSRLDSPHDLRGKRIMMTSATDPECLAMLVSEGVALESVTLVPHSWDIEDLVAGRVDAMSAYLTSEPYHMQERGVPAAYIRPINYGVDFYGDCLVSTEEQVEKHPERVEAFLRAVQRGWRYAMENPEELAQLIRARYSSELSMEHLLFEAKTMRRLIRPDFVEIGHMNPERWRHIADLYVKLGMMSPDYDLSGFLYPEFKENLQARKQQAIRMTLIVLGIFLFVGTGITAMLFFFNARLSRQVHERTAALSASERSFRAFFEMASVGVAQFEGVSHRFIKVNQKFSDLTGYSATELGQLTPHDLVHPDDWQVSQDAMQSLVAKTHKEITLEKRYVRKDGTFFWGLATISPLWGKADHPEFYLAVVRDISMRKKAEEKLMLAAKVFENTVEGIVVTDVHGTIEQVNPGFSIITGYTPQEAVGGNPRILKSDRHPQHFYQDMWAKLVADGHWAGEIWNRRKNGESYPEWLTISAIKNDAGEITNYVSIFHDITELKRQQDALEYQAQHDALTGLPNRILLGDRLRMALAQLERSEGKLALLFFDLDNFKTINDGLGHGVGDALLVELSRRMEKLLRSGDTLARLGGDEFLVLLPEIESVDAASHIANRMLEALKAPFHHGDVEYFVTASIGVTIAPDDGSEGSKLIKNADMAMYRAKNLGRNNYQYFTPEMDVAAHRRISMEYKLRKAIEAQEFELFYQPLVHIQSGEILGAEALIRWRSDGKLISPAEFIPLAEDSGLILPLGDWVLRTAARQAKLWQDAGHDLTMSVNISSRQFSGTDLALTLREVLLHTELRPGKLYFEITESMLMGDVSKAETTLLNLREAGGTFFLDDFGTGYSSLSYLKRLPIDGLKIDRSFVKDITDDPDSRAIVAAIVSMARTLNLRLVAEGVETQAQRSLLASMGPIVLQGYLASRPVPAQEFEELLAKGVLLSPLVG
ncbi:PAS domain S-box-containing protein/diguanylate cyclase (GGDEF) domain-containing protein [Desulfomicrobium norvegicum]|uniref:PAS domain S-box-containing protein/diguanylate cyclase (GGDEF) domain-containing protein n=1 Tax=Desulfomicrobium norvegicum (strain DSM 1741 / NCIMB 8310) TaxID=52561 RepID=A0A8G2C663_DESNO|nr:EAL domain-containing protein [Desulfomicrobium norvegicum]SFM21279.1 PAS domain S-box-containing protein/diguanylate cyclase (GGDEF) domain-containing protein [Desulfomicrobium norvegicum]